MKDFDRNVVKLDITVVNTEGKEVKEAKEPKEHTEVVREFPTEEVEETSQALI